MSNIYELELHEKLSLKDNSYIRRVPGGWIYVEFVESIESVIPDPAHFLSPVFVPFNDEFKTFKEPERDTREDKDISSVGEEYDPLRHGFEDK